MQLWKQHRSQPRTEKLNMERLRGGGKKERGEGAAKWNSNAVPSLPEGRKL